MNTIYDAIVIGAGQAGLAAGYYLRQTQLRFLILEAGDEPVGSWPNYYDSLSLNSAARYSALPGLPFPGAPNSYPGRDEVVAYLRSYGAFFKLPILTGVRVATVERTGDIFRLTTSQGIFEAHAVVAATGFFGRPNVPDIPGRTGYRGRVLHVAAYRHAAPFGGQRVVIVGGGNAAVQIGVELARVARVTLATREPIRFLPQQVLGRDIHFWLRLTGLDRTQWLGDQSTPVYDSGTYRLALAANRPDRQPMFKRFTAEGVVWSDDQPENVDAVIFATGYRPDLGYLAGLGALDEAGQVFQQEGVSTTVPGLYYVGLPRQRSAASATLRGVGADAKLVIHHLRRYWEQSQQGQPGRRASRLAVRRQAEAWALRGSELVGLLSLITFAVKEQLAAQQLPAPRLVADTLVRSSEAGAGFLGFGDAAAIYAQKSLILRI